MWQMKNNYEIGHAEFKKLVNAGSSNLTAYIATAGTTFVIGYGFGWRGGRWFANRKHRKEQMKLLGHKKPRRWHSLGHVKPREWQFSFLRRRLIRPKAPETVVDAPEKMLKSAPTTHANPGQLRQSKSC
uniref:Uncharacterized protein n=1 Tax=Rhizophora mucronata TaxID=61149 RepID=A0A2P2JU11_RHIMU